MGSGYANMACTKLIYFFTDVRKPLTRETNIIICQTSQPKCCDVKQSNINHLTGGQLQPLHGLNCYYELRGNVRDKMHGIALDLRLCN